MTIHEPFDLNGLDGLDIADTPPMPAEAATDENPMAELEEWADDVLSSGSNANAGQPRFYDIETGPLPEDYLRSIYHEKTQEEFAETCDKRWKPDTVAIKYAEYKANAWTEFVEKAALSPMTGRVLLLGVLCGETLTFLHNDKDEAGILTSFWALVDDWLAGKCPIIGHNSASFDLPFIVRRSWILGVNVPHEVRQGRYWHPLFRDTMEAWSFGAREYTKLNALGKLFGVGQKTEGVDGKDFSKLWFGQMPTQQYGDAAQQREKAIEYNGQDLFLTAAIAKKMGMV